MSPQDSKPLHIAMYPWFAIGHFNSYLHLANKLAQRGHIISFLLPTKNQQKLASINPYPNLVTFYPITVPPVDGLPAGAESTNDVHPKDRSKIMAARDLTQDQLDSYLAQLKPDFLFFDSPEWVPQVARKHGVKPVYYAVFYVSMFAYCNLQARNLPLNHRLTEGDLIEPPPGFPSSIKFRPSEARTTARVFSSDFGNGMTFLEKQDLGIQESVAIGFRSCRETEGAYADFLEKQLGKPVLLAGFLFPDPPASNLDEFFDNWLNGFGHGTVIYCALGSEASIEKDQFDELVLGLELTGMPFLAAIKPPAGYETIESALPEGFIERTKGRGMVRGDWVPQPQIVQHPSVGCFVSHCGTGSLSEALMGGCQLVLIPLNLDQYINARLMSVDMRVAVEVEKGENDDFFYKEALQKAVELVMNLEGQVGKELKANNAKWRELLFKEGIEESYINSFVKSLRGVWFTQKRYEVWVWNEPNPYQVFVWQIQGFHTHTSNP